MVRRILIIVPDLLVESERESALRQSLPSLASVAEAGTLSKVCPLPPIDTPEALYLGMGSAEAQMRQGPLTVSALNADPPDRSTHFHLSLMSVTDGVACTPEFLLSPEEAEIFWAAAKRLDTSTLTLLRGSELDHGLVWENVGDLGTTPAHGMNGKPIRQSLPEGDGESLLRRLIDDSVNLLSELPFNRQKVEEGLAPFNLLWPWGQGIRQKVPNLLLRRGEFATVESSSLRLAGLTRLTGYRHVDRREFGRGLGTKFADIANRALARDISIIVIDAFSEFRAEDRQEEFNWLTREFERELIKPLRERGAKDPTRLTILAPSTSGKLGLGVTTLLQKPESGYLPFDERTLDEKSVPKRDLPSLVEDALLQ